MEAKQERRNHIKTLITSDPGLPRANPTKSYWQREPHPFAAIQSSVLPETVDVVIIGSGITSATVCKALLEKAPTARIAVLEARTLCSGATGRNGGQLATNAGEQYASLAAQFGKQEAGSIVQHTLDTVKRMQQVVAEVGAEHCDYQQTTKIRTFLDNRSFEAARASVKQLESDHPAYKGMYQVVGPDRLKDYGVQEGVGALVHSAASVWPYRLVTKLFESLLQKYSPRFSIDTNTPVMAITYQAAATYKYRLSTPRGDVQCKKVVHCTNGYAGHLLPGLRGSIFPICGAMTVQDLQGVVPNMGSHYSWAFHYTPRRDTKTDQIQDGLNYLIQNPKSNLFYFGGDNSTWDESLHADDSQGCRTSTDTLQEVLPKMFSKNPLSEDARKKQLVAHWTGVLGYSFDGVPLVGRLSKAMTSRDGNDEWAAVAFNGYGMPNCWNAGEALVEMMINENSPERLPKPYIITKKRFEGQPVDKSVSMLQEMENVETRSRL